jgi:hypothetical protein
LTIRRGIQQGGLEVSVQLGVQLPIIAEENTNGLLRIDAANFEIGTESMLYEIAVVRGNLKSVGASNLHQTLVTSLSSDSVSQLLPHLGNVARRVEVGIEECLASSESCHMTCSWS